MIASDDHPEQDKNRQVRYAVVGLGHIAQVAVLPAFANASNAKLAALVSGDPVKRVELGKRYDVEHCVDYDGLDRLIAEGWVDAVYIALPNHLHCEFTLRAARAGAHVLCEKPMAVTEQECEAMIETCQKHQVKLMVAYRLHFAEAHLRIVEHCREGALGDLRFMSSVFSQDVKPGDVRLLPIERGGGTVYDMGVYCINAARYLFRDEPLAVAATSTTSSDPRFADCDPCTSAILRFGDERLAMFTSSFDATRTATLQIVGTEGEIDMRSAYEYAEPVSFALRRGEEVERERFPKSDQFCPEIIHFSRCINESIDPGPSGLEGLADVRIVRAIHAAARRGTAIELASATPPPSRPDLSQAMRCPAIAKPQEIHASGPGK
jgi:glucose-fructose oxidoreductase